MIEYADSKLDDYLHWGYELTEKYFLLTWQINVYKWVTTGLTEKKSCKKPKKDIPKKKLQNEKAIKEKSKNRYKNLSEEEKDKIKEYQRKGYQ